MRYLYLLLVLVLLLTCSTAAQSSEAASPATKDDCSIAGTVVSLTSSSPLKNSLLQLFSADNNSEQESVALRTDGGGKFEFKGIRAGRYRLRVTRHGFVTQEYGQRKFTDPGAILTLSAGQNMKDLIFRLVPSAVISGRIENEDGEPLPWASVGALRESYSQGKRTLSIEETVLTNDHGEYRLFGLRPGRYFVAVSYRAGGSQMRGDEEENFGPATTSGVDYVRTYYPGTLDPSKAQAITLKAGEENSSTDLLLEPVAVHSVRGRVINLITTSSKQPRNDIYVQLRSRDVGLYSRAMFARENGAKPDGKFELANVAAGSYILTAGFFEEGKVHQAHAEVDVGNADVEGVQVTIKPGVAVSGHLYWDGTPSIQGDGVFVTASGGDGYVGPGAFGRVQPDGSFTLKELADGSRRVLVSGPSDECYLKAVTYGGVDSLEDGFVARPGAASLDVTLSSRGAHVQGAVADADGLPSVGVWVALVPDAKYHNRPQLYKSTQTDQHGQFLLRGIAPGDYTLFSWDEVENGAWEDPDFLKPYAEKGEKVTVAEGESKSVNLTSIKTAGTEEQKP
jgi:Carboxypeptidase regulatory-like domain